MEIKDNLFETEYQFLKFEKQTEFVLEKKLLLIVCNTPVSQMRRVDTSWFVSNLSKRRLFNRCLYVLKCKKEI